MTAQTPEGRVKSKLDSELKRLISRNIPLWHFNPAGTAYGKAGVPDKIVCIAGHMVGLEVKADRLKKPTVLQMKCMNDIEAAGGKCFVVYDKRTIDLVVLYLLQYWMANRVSN